MPLWSQVQPSAYGGAVELDSEHMKTPPPVSRGAYPTMIGSEERDNYLSGGVVVSAAYTDNLLLLGDKAISDEYYSVAPTISLDRRTSRHTESLHYSSGFRFYQNTSNLNAVTQDGSASLSYHFTPYAALIISDSVNQNSNPYNSGNPFSGGGVSGAPGSQNAALIEPYADELTNSTSAGLEYQYAKNAMIGASGSFSFLQFSGHSNLPTLSDEHTTGGNAFYSRRFGKSYAGVTYQFAKYVTHPFGSYTVSNTVFGFYTRYFARTVSVSLLGGPEHYTSWGQDRDKSGAWTPAVQASVGWQARHANLAANFAHVVSGAGGLIGTFHSDTGGLSGQMAFSRRWSGGVHTEYSRYKNLSSVPLNFGYFPGGDTISGGIEVQRSILELLALQIGYLHLHQNYGNLTTNQSSHDTNQAIVGISYQFKRPLGR